MRQVVEPKPGLPTDPNDVRAFIDVFTDMSGLFVINNESGWYEGWMIHDLQVPAVAAPRDPDRFDGDADAQRETRMRFIPAANASAGRDSDDRWPGAALASAATTLRSATPAPVSRALTVPSRPPDRPSSTPMSGSVTAT